jgi:hypothetical protein
MDEIFKDIPGYEGLYQASPSGKIRSILSSKPRILKANQDRCGYLYYGLYRNGKSKSLKEHRLVAVTFIENAGGKEEVNHKNGIKTDNRVENLEWNTPSENILHGYKHGLHRSDVNRTRTASAAMAASRRKKVIDCSSGKIFISAKEAAQNSTFTYSHLRMMLNGGCSNKSNFKYL